mmetsp:Transcript_21580/g.54459  ORF Transcript_21580/g.54459 Transcript_21580/m.54459 type:complete len:478 (-) Transcript_21580:32-1465(-)
MKLFFQIKTFRNMISVDLKIKTIWLQKLKKNNVLSKNTFEKFILSKKTTIRLLELFYTHLTKVQSICIPYQICGFDILGSARTGSGKTIAFLIPIIEFFYTIKWNLKNGISALIITPTRELSLQNYYVLKDLLKYHSFSHGVVMGGASKKTEIERLEKDITILVATPGRLLDHLKTTKNIKIQNLQFLIIDEADRCLEIGFEEEIIAIVRFLPKKRQTILFSATQTRNVQSLYKISFQKTPVLLEIKENKKVKIIQNIEQGFVICKPDDKLVFLLTLIKKNRKKKIITFFNSCNEVKFFSALFRVIGLNVLELHGAKKQFKRTSTFFKFCKAKESILFCTDIAARGLDIPAVDWILQFSPPLEPKEYIHRIGRTGRGIHGKGWTLLFLYPSEIGFLKFLKNDNINIKEFIFKKKKFSLLKQRISKFIEKNFYLKKLSKLALKSFLNSYKSYRLKNIFDVKKINVKSVSEGFGLNLSA